jgi:hypothetical protein
VDPVDPAAFQGGSADEFLLESINPNRICLYAGIGDMEDMFDVVHWFTGSFVH